jgi:hypothetical protein
MLRFTTLSLPSLYLEHQGAKEWEKCKCFHSMRENVTSMRANSGSLSLFHVLLQCPHKPRKPHSFPKQRLRHSPRVLYKNHPLNVIVTQLLSKQKFCLKFMLCSFREIALEYYLSWRLFCHLSTYAILILKASLAKAVYISVSNEDGAAHLLTAVVL